MPSVSVVSRPTNDLPNFATDYSGKVDRLGEIVREHITNEFFSLRNTSSIVNDSGISKILINSNYLWRFVDG